MEFRVFHPTPPAEVAEGETTKTPVLYYLSGLTCTSENVATKGYPQKGAAEAGIALILPDTSPRGVGIEGEDESYDFGSGAGFYLDATEEPWSGHYKMYSYVTEELPAVAKAAFPHLAIGENEAIFGHSMGGHGALSLALKNPGKYKSVSAFAPICNPVNCPWGQKAFSGYLGQANTEAWEAYDSSILAKAYSGPQLDILVDQGEADNFLTQGQLLPETLVEAAEANDALSLEYRLQTGYDHSYYTIATFMDDHIAFHARHLVTE